MTDQQLIGALLRLKVETGSLACAGCGHEHNCSLQGCRILREAVAALREQEERRWISVTERLPKLIPCRAGTAYSEAVNVLTSGRKVITAIYDGTDWLGPFGFWDAEDEVITHWAPVLLPLPEPPKEND